MTAKLGNRIYHYGLKAGLPYEALRRTVNAIDAVPNLSDFARRKRLAEGLADQSKWQGFVNRDAAFRTFSPGELPQSDRLVEIGRAVYERNADRHELEREKSGKSPITHLWENVTEEEKAEIVDVATSPDVAQIMCGYFGSIPRFDNADIWISRPNAGNVGSQLFHLDKPDRRYTSIFLNILPVDDSNGPFSMLPKPESDTVRQATEYERIYYHEDGRLPDTKLSELGMADSLVKLTGDSGAGGIVDTSECLHAGSRCESGIRVVMILSYMHAHKPGLCKFTDFAEKYPNDPVRRALLGV